MKKVLWLLLFCWLPVAVLYADTKKDAIPTTEGQLVAKLLDCMRYHDTVDYIALFPTYDTLWPMVFTYPPKDEHETQEMDYLRQHPEVIQKFDPSYDSSIVQNYLYVLDKGKKEGLHWNNIELLRFELKKEMLTRDLVGFEHIAPVRFMGLVFIKDMLSQHVYAFSVKEMQNISGRWYGGQVLNIYEAADETEFWQKQAAELKKLRMMKEYGLTDSAYAAMTKADKKATKENADDDDADDSDDNSTAADNNEPNNPLAVDMHLYDKATADDKPYHQPNGLSVQEVADRKLFVGKFDNQIPVRLYIRYIKGNCPEGICSWEAIYKFGDQDDYIKLDVTKTKDGKWQFVEDPPIGSMDLTFKGDVFTGTWASSDIQTGYEVRLQEAPLSASEAKTLDKIVQNGSWAKGREKEKDKEDDNQPVKGINEDITNGIH